MGLKNDLIKRSAVGNVTGEATERKSVTISKPCPRSRPMRWVSLHHHSTYSYGDALGLPLEHVERAGEIGMTRMALTEHGNTASHVKFEQAAGKYGIDPIYGCEFYMAPGQTQRKNHLLVLA